MNSCIICIEKKIKRHRKYTRTGRDSKLILAFEELIEEVQQGKVSKGNLEVMTFIKGNIVN